MTQKEIDLLSKRIDDLQAANELTIERLKELERDTFRQRLKRKLHADPFYQHSMDALNPWSAMNQPHPIKLIQRLYVRFCEAVK